MSKSKLKLKSASTPSSCPVKFCWGTFCRSVLSNEVDKTIHNVVPSLVLVIPSVADMPTNIAIPIGDLALYVLFERAPGEEGKIETDLVAELNLPTAQSQAIKVVLEPQHTHFQMAIRFVGAYIPIQTDKSHAEISLTCVIKYKNKEIGKVVLLVKVTILEDKK
jgi:hypothetical protein